MSELKTYHIRYRINSVVAAVRFMNRWNVYSVSQRSESLAWTQFHAQMNNDCLLNSVEDCCLLVDTF